MFSEFIASLPKVLFISNSIYIDSTLLPNELLNLLKRTAVFSNPEYYKKQALRLSVYKVPNLIMPISWKGVLEQYSGRLHRMYEDKNIVKIYDYIDNNVPLLVKMYTKRLKGYKNLDYNIKGDTGVQYEFDDI